MDPIFPSFPQTLEKPGCCLTPLPPGERRSGRAALRAGLRAGGAAHKAQQGLQSLFCSPAQPLRPRRSRHRHGRPCPDDPHPAAAAATRLPPTPPMLRQRPGQAARRERAGPSPRPHGLSPRMGLSSFSSSLVFLWSAPR